MDESSTMQLTFHEMALAETLDIRAAGPLLATLLGARGQALRLDASRVKVMGAQCMQVLISAHQTWDRDGLTLSVADPSPDFLDALAVAGLGMDNLVESEQGQ